MRAHAAAFLSDAEARPDSPEAGVAHRAAGHHLLVRRRVSRGAGSLGTRARFVPTRPRRRSGLSLRTGPRRRRDGQSRRLHRGLSVRSIARFRSSNACRARLAGLTHVGTLAFGKMHAALFESDAWRPCARRRRTPSNSLASRASTTCPCVRAFGVFLEGWATAASGAIGGGLEDMRRGVRAAARTERSVVRRAIEDRAGRGRSRAGDLDRALAILDEALATADRIGHSRIRSRTASGARRNPAEARPRQPRARGRSLPDRHRRREAARNAQLRTARGACARQALPIDRPPRRSPRRPRAGARRLFADAGNARDRRGAGAAGGAGGRPTRSRPKQRSGSD